MLMPAGVREESYRVSACPLYLPDPPREHAEAGGFYGAPLCRACGSRRICMRRREVCRARRRGPAGRSGGAGERRGPGRDPAADRAAAAECLACAEWLERRENIQDTETGGGAWN